MEGERKEEGEKVVRGLEIGINSEMGREEREKRR